jgi:hypothetical protein
LLNNSEENIWTQEGEVAGDWRTLRNEELHNFYASPNIIRIISIIKSRRINGRRI